ncbi:MAG: lysophospholipid acyltransferase family protein [Planctomycetes bacterium]|nr:lysophospholipid acyltransferase family protein [Planctomycetota bacterium]MBI3834166.1 lysophospholipid acyltransferase family protein [Planctomycetota bacterium]
MQHSGPLQWLAYFAVKSLFAIMQVFPLDWNLQTARIFARIWAKIMPRHRQRALAHLSAAYQGKLSAREISRLADRCLDSVVMFAVEVICLPRLINRWTWSRYIHLVNFDEALKLFLEGRGAILVTGHYGAFELIGHLLAALDFRTVAVMRPLDNARLNQFIVDSRTTHGLELLDKRGAATQAEELLRDGALVGFIGDQDAGRKGVFVDFFERPASTYKSIGLLAMATSSPIVIGYARRRGDCAKYDIGVQRIIYPQEWETQSSPLQWITQVYTSAIEEFVRADPSQYLWIHRRWKSQPRSSNS